MRLDSPDAIMHIDRQPGRSLFEPAARVLFGLRWSSFLPIHRLGRILGIRRKIAGRIERPLLSLPALLFLVHGPHARFHGRPRLRPKLREKRVGEF